MSVQHSAIAGADCHPNATVTYTFQLADITALASSVLWKPFTGYTILKEYSVVLQGGFLTNNQTLALLDGGSTVIDSLVVPFAGSGVGIVVAHTALNITIANASYLQMVPQSGAPTGGPTKFVVSITLGRP